MADGPVALKPLEFLRGEDLRNEPHSAVHAERRSAAGRDGDSGALLAAVLEGEETVVTQNGCVRVSENGEHAALVSGFMVSAQGGAGKMRECGEGSRLECVVLASHPRSLRVFE